MSKKARQLVEAVLQAHRTRLGDISHADSLVLAHVVALLQAPHLGALSIEQNSRKAKNETHTNISKF